jgi:hypothetical protein
MADAYLNKNKGVQTTKNEAYEKALEAWKKKKPNSMDKSSYAGFDNVGAALNAWKKEKPQKSDFKQTEAVNTTPSPNSKTTETVQVRSDASSVRTPVESSGSSYPSRPRGEERGKGKIGQNINEFIRGLKPSKDRLSPSQRFEKRMGRRETFGERKRRRG